MPTAQSAARFGRGGAGWRVHQAVVGRHDYKDRVGPICEQDDGSEQPAQLESAEKGNDSEKPADDREARLPGDGGPGDASVVDRSLKPVSFLKTIDIRAARGGRTAPTRRKIPRRRTDCQGRNAWSPSRLRSTAKRSVSRQSPIHRCFGCSVSISSS